MNTFKMALFGHRDFTGHILLESRLSPILYTLMHKYDFVEIYVGRNGEFDLFSASVVKRVQRTCELENSEMVLVLPYTVRDLEHYEAYYDRIIVSESIKKVHPKRAITERNRRMVEMSDLIICYVDRESGGAYEAVRYARSLGKAVINLAQENLGLSVDYV